VNHAERWQLAQNLCDRLVARYPGEILIGGVYGSAARGTDTAWSDLEMFFVVQDGSQIKRQHLLYRGIAVGYQAIQQRELEAILTTPSNEWPYHMGMLSVLHVLHGDPALIQAWLRMGQMVPEERFRAALEAALPALVVESYGRIHSCRERGNLRDVGIAAIEVLLEMNQALCLLNRRWVTHDYYQGLVDAFSFPKLPEGYAKLVPALWSAREIEEIVPLAEQLMAGYWRLLADEGIKVTDYHSIDDIVV
jgi:hypothetical protein